jgi:DnaK suppressor protein
MTEEKSYEKLNEKEIGQIKADLTNRKNQILEDLKDISEEGGDRKVKFPEYGDKSDENAQEIGEYTTNLATDKVLESTLRDIDTSLDRIEKGTYGICKYCGEPISKKRMLARPVASTCVKCKTKLQKQP